MNDILRQRLIIIRIIRNISVVLVFVFMLFITFRYIFPIVDGIGFASGTMRKYAEYIIFTPILVLTYLTAFGFNRLINNSIMVKLFANIDKKIKPVSFSNVYKSKENFHGKVVNSAAILPYHSDISKVTRTIVLDFDNSATIFMTDFKTEDTEEAVITNINFKGAVIAFISDKPIIDTEGSAVFIDKSFYEKCKECTAYEKYSKSAPYDINNSKILESFYIYFSNEEIAKKFSNISILDAVLKIKESFGGAKVSLSFQNNSFYILVENETIHLKTNKDGFDIFTARLKSAINMYDILKK